MFNGTDYVTIALRNLENKIYLSDLGTTYDHSTKTEEEMKEICKQNHIVYDERYLTVEFSSLEDIDNVFSAIKQIANI